jgi:hypothetical protein
MIKYTLNCMKLYEIVLNYITINYNLKINKFIN